MSEAKLFFIDSRFRKTGGTVSDFTVVFPDTVIPYSIDVESIQIPKTWNNVDENNCYMDIEERNVSGDTIETFTISLHSGLYELTHFMEELAEKINEGSVLGYTYTVNNALHTNKITISSADDTEIYRLLFSTGTNASTSLRTVLGFGEIDTSVLEYVNTGSSKYNLIRYQSFFLRSDHATTRDQNVQLCGSASYAAAFEYADPDNNIVEVFPIPSSTTDMDALSITSQRREVKIACTTNELHFRLTDIYNTEITFGASDSWSIIAWIRYN
jgi:hypothetical protein